MLNAASVVVVGGIVSYLYIYGLGALLFSASYELHHFSIFVGLLGACASLACSVFVALKYIQAHLAICN